MAQEIEKKYLLYEDGVNYATPEFLENIGFLNDVRWRVIGEGIQIVQGYFDVESGKNLAEKLGMEVDFFPTESRLRKKGNLYLFTLKGEGGLVRNEVENEISPKIFHDYWPLTHRKRVDKSRLTLPYGRHSLEIDVYKDRSLIVAEIEVPTIEEARRLISLGKDVTGNIKYKNKNLAK